MLETKVLIQKILLKHNEKLLFTACIRRKGSNRNNKDKRSLHGYTNSVKSSSTYRKIILQVTWGQHNRSANILKTKDLTQDNKRLEKNHRLLSIFFYFNFPLHFSRPKSFWPTLSLYSSFHFSLKTVKSSVNYHHHHHQYFND